MTPGALRAPESRSQTPSAYGLMLGVQATEAATTLLYSGEQFDANIGKQPTFRTSLGPYLCHFGAVGVIFEQAQVG